MIYILEARTRPDGGDLAYRFCVEGGGCERVATFGDALHRAQAFLTARGGRLRLVADEAAGRTELRLAAHASLYVARFVGLGQARGQSQAIRAAFEAAQRRPLAIGQLFLTEGMDLRPLAESYGVGERHIALVEVPAASPAASLVRLIEALRGRRIEVGGERVVPAPFYLAERQRPWFAARGVPRLAAFHLEERNGVTHLLVEEAPPGLSAPLPIESRFHLFPLGGADEAALMAAMERLSASLESGETIAALSRRKQAEYEAAGGWPYTLALVAEDEEALRDELRKAVQGVPRALAQGASWQTPRGSAFAARPLGRSALAFVYPGAFNSYVGMGAELFLRFPTLHDRLAAYVADVGRSMGDRLIFPRWGRPPDREALASAAAGLAADGVALIESGTLLALAHTLILKEEFGLRPQAAMGYSLGEVSMLWANGVWRDGEQASRAWQQSPLFRERLFGPKRLLEELWGNADWETWIVKAPREVVEAVVAEEERLYLTIVNLPDEVVIAGASAACRRALARLGAHALRVPYDAVIHAPPAEQEFERFVALYDHETRPITIPRFYSAASEGALRLERRTLAETLARMSCRPLDFPALVERLYAEGVRLFVEVGAQATCTRWVGRILRGRPHAVRAMDRAGRSGEQALMAVLAMLMAHGVVPRQQRDDAVVAPPSAVSEALTQLTAQSKRLAEAQLAFLEAQRTMVRQTATLLEAAVRGGLPSLSPAPRFDEAAIREFARGDAERCFGPSYARFRGRRIPRLPNGDLLLMHRVIAIEGEAGVVREGAVLTSEYDVAPDAWFFRDGSTALPYAVVMEMALQPCGFLAAYLGSTFPYPQADLYFRNLDGRGRLHHLPDLRGKRVVNRVELLGSTAAGGIIIQRYRFALSSEGRTFYEGESSFGYFTRAALEGQAGLDTVAPWRESHLRAQWESAPFEALTLPRGRLHLLDRFWFGDGGERGAGVVYAEGTVDPAAWFFEAHFYQDPVMPGSLGVEAMQQAMAAWAQWRGLGTTFAPLGDNETVWKYRGQITREAGALRLEVHLHAVEPLDDGRWRLIGAGSLWRGERRIYAVQGLGIEVENNARREG